MQTISIRLELKGEPAHKFKTVKDALGFPTNTSVLIHLINDAYENAKNNPEKET